MSTGEELARPASALIGERISGSACRSRPRGWLVRRALLGADVVGLSLAFAVVQVVFDPGSSADRLGGWAEPLIFVATLPIWIVAAKLYGLYDRDEERNDHSTVDDVLGVFHLVTVCSWLTFLGSWATGLADPDLFKLATFWGLAIVSMTVGRAAARALCRRTPNYLQRTLVVGADDVGQVLARKILRHPEYGLDLIGFVGPDDSALRSDLVHLPVLGPPTELVRLVRIYGVERVIFVDSDEVTADAIPMVRSLENRNVQVDLVPGLHELIAPGVHVHTVEGLPLIALARGDLDRTSRLLKRALDLTLGSVMLVLAAPLLLVIALLIRLSSPGPVLFRQQRLGRDMRPFTILKFRTMHCGADDAPHREYVSSSMNPDAAARHGGLYKLERPDAVTGVGRWLRRTSLDELPQLINVVRGEMSLVGPRPCLEYEVEHFAPHHFERFRVLPGLTGLWQVTARAQATFGEALNMDVAYVRSWSMSRDIWLLCRTPAQIFSRRGTA